MGREGNAVRERLARHDFPDAHCRQRLGVRLEEPIPPLRGAAEVYAFSGKPWTDFSYRKLRRQLRTAPRP
jgi:hypothetical protein